MIKNFTTFINENIENNKYIDTILEYVYYNNPDDDEIEIIKNPPLWILEGSKQFVKNQNIKVLYRGLNNNYNDGISYTYDKEIAKKFGDKIIEIPLPEKFVSIEFIFNYVKTNKYYPKTASNDFKEYIDNYDIGEKEILVI